jgi:hypothetical protein
VHGYRRGEEDRPTDGIAGMKFPEVAVLDPWIIKLRPDSLACQAANVTGQFINDDLAIMYDPQRPAQIMVDTMVHELLHVIWEQSGANQIVDSVEGNSDGEKLIRKITPRLISLLRANPWLVRAIKSC